MRSVPRAAIAALVAVQAMFLHAQSARQGVTPASEENHFESPMIIELPVPAVAELSGDAAIRLADVSKFVCDKNVSLIDLTLTTSHKGPRDARTLELILRGSIRVTASVDRRTDLAVRIRNEERVWSAQFLRNHETEEGRSTWFRMALTVEDEAGFLSALGSEHPPIFEITVTVRDDG